MAIFPTFFFFGNIGQEHVLNDILERKTVFLGYKNNKFKKSKNWDFSKGGKPWFWSNMDHFSNLFFKQYRPEKCVLRYSRKKKNDFLHHNNKKFKKSKTWDFSKGVNTWFWFKNGLFSQLRPEKCSLRYSRTKKTSF